MSVKKANLTSGDLNEFQLDALRRITPEVFSENRIDWEKLKAVLGEHIDPRIEKFSFNWAGKGNAIKNVLIPSRGTLRPAKKESIKFDESENLFIEGDNLEVLKLLQKAYFEKVKMIYIDPPYNTGGDFVYHDDFVAPLKGYLEQTGQTDASGNKLKTNAETNGRFHSDWLSMMYPRLKLAWNLLKEDGVIFISIDDNEMPHLRMMMDEIFGEENFVGQLIWNKQHSQQQGIFKKYHEYILVYSKNELTENIKGGDGEIVAGALKKISKANPESEFTFPAGTRVDTTNDIELTGTYGEGEKVTVVSGKFIAKNGKLTQNVTLSAGWTQKDQMKSWFGGLETIDTKGQKVLEFFFNSEGKLKCRKDRTRITPPTILPEFGMVSEQTEALKELMGGYYFDNPKPVEMIKLFAEWFTKDDDMILDIFAGSGTTAHSVMQLNSENGGGRRWICVQLPEKCAENSEAFKAGFLTIADIAKERIKRASELFKTGKNNDLGFKAFKLGVSNYPENNFEFDPAKTEEENAKEFEKYLDKSKQSTIFDEADETDILYEIIIKEGLSLNTSMATKKIGKNDLYVLTDENREIQVCLEAKIEPETAKMLTSKDYKNRAFVCFDHALDDTTKANLGLNLELKTI